MSNETPKKKLNNIIFTADSRFGEGALKSGKINADQFADLMAKLTIGGRIVVKPGYRKDGSAVLGERNEHLHFFEVLPPQVEEAKANYNKRNTAKRTFTNEDSI